MAAGCVVNDLAHLLAIRQQAAGEDADAEIRLGQVNSHRAIRTFRIDLLNERAAQHFLLGRIKVAKAALAGFVSQDERAELAVEGRVPEQNAIRADVAQVAEPGFADFLIDTRPELAFAAENVLHQLRGNASICGNPHNFRVKLILPAIHNRLGGFHAAGIRGTVGFKPAGWARAGIDQALPDEQARQEVVLIGRDQLACQLGRPKPGGGTIHRHE